jgi:hypothetical protein
VGAIPFQSGCRNTLVFVFFFCARVRASQCNFHNATYNDLALFK